MKKPKIAILGGGMGALSTAWHLVKDGDWQDRFESITVYQMGWRLGGKCATGRGPCDRVEEHGIHLFGGGYYNTLLMMRAVYRDLHGPAGDQQFKENFEHQFTSVSVTDGEKSAVRLPPSPLTLDNLQTITSLSNWIADALANLKSYLRDSGPTPGMFTVLRHGDSIVRKLGGALGHPPLHIESVLQSVDLLTRQLRDDPESAKATLAVLRSSVGPEPRDPRLTPMNTDQPHWGTLTVEEQSIGTALLRWFRTANFIAAFASGCLEQILSPDTTLQTRDNEDYAAWLQRHGAWDSTIELGIVQAPIRILYQYRNGDASHARHRSMGAGAYLHWSIRTFAYVSSPFWFFEKGTGESVVAPVFECLKRRGVRFEFFRKVENLELSADRQRIQTITLRQQATTTPTHTPYDPLVNGNWPAKPRHEALHEGALIKELPDDELESYWSRFGEARVQSLTLGVDFDAVVLGISLGAIPLVCQDLLAHSQAWRDMVTHIGTVETQSLQMWMDRSSHALKINEGLNPVIEDDDTGLGAGLAVPFDGFSDFTSLIPHEGWPRDHKPRSLWYFSDVMKTPPGAPDLTDPDYPGTRKMQVVENAKAFLENELGKLLSAFSPARGGFDYQRLMVPLAAPNISDADRLAQQWIRANVQPSDRYVQALTGTTRHRLHAGRSADFDNLYLAGDWTFNGLNVGCVEATVMSGMLAANDLMERKLDGGVIGYFGR
ncbi:MAG: NAD(P)-binding protein [Hydrogenophaga sp.]